MSSVTTVVGIAVGSVTIATFYAGNSFARDPIHEPATTAVSAAAAKPRVVTVTGSDFRFEAPDVIPAGLTTFRFVNKGPSLHHMALLRITGGKTFTDLQAALAKPGALPAWIHEVGGPNAPVPGAESNATAVLEPGSYALICFVDLGGPPHFMKGMIKPLRVVTPKGPREREPKADVIATLVDYNFKLSGPIKPGNRTIRVHNAGKQHHEVQLVQLPPGVSLGNFMKWLEKQEGPPPGKAIGGISGLDPGKHQHFTAHFTPGNYALICFLPDTGDGKPHFVHGMAQQIAVK